MSMSMELGGRMEQSMAMQLTFAQKMSLEVLQLNVQALEARVTEELESNPLLEKKAQELSEALVEPNSEPGESPPEQDHKEAMMELVEPTLAEGNYLRPNSAEEDLDPLDLIADKSPDFETAMAEQLEFHNLEPELKIRVQTVLSLLDHRGYLTEPLESCQTDHEDEQLRQLWPKALRFIQEQLEPAGMGASNLQECLGLQLLRRGHGLGVEETIISQHFDDLLHNRLDLIAAGLKQPLERIKEAIELIKSLEFRPTARFFEQPSVVLNPDATIKYDAPDLLRPDGRFRIQLSRRGQPELEVIPGSQYRYEGMSKQEKNYLLNSTNSAKSLIEAVRRRNETLLLVLQTICQRQRAFFEEGPSALNSLQMQEIAQDLNMSAATITRTVKDKVVRTDYGLFELKYFFSLKKVKMGSGEITGRDELLESLRKVVDEENKAKPLSDAAISKLLATKGHKLAVRTVSKYRGLLSIPSSSKRKQF
jgi:RNA polymerase sigma-54 factor